MRAVGSLAEGLPANLGIATLVLLRLKPLSAEAEPNKKARDSAQDMANAQAATTWLWSSVGQKLSFG